MIEIYAELLFLENIIMNYLILTITSKICGSSVTKKRLFLGAFIGALYAFVFFVPSIQFLYSTVMKILFSCLIVSISFSPHSIKYFVKLMVSFYGISFALGGLVLAGIYFTDMSGLIKNNVIYVRDLSYLKILLSAIIGYFMMIYLAKLFKYRILNNELYVNIQIEMDGKSAYVKGILDTANFLVEPISQVPVIVIEYLALQGFLPEDFKDILKSIDMIPENIYELEWGRRLRYIPYTSLGTQNGMLVGIRPDFISIQKGNRQYNFRNIVIGIYNGTIGNEDYSALLHPDILKEEAEYEINKA
ncbi:MAG: sigma-E processing peptidase SpoIIGA [Clostridiales bacterium]|nr:sigma-E processing peptidase SpoIIGA [Clostridiales bacterium]